MSDFITILGFILPGLVGGLIGYFASLSKQNRDAKERFFYEVYPKRLELYSKTFLIMQGFEANVKDSEKNKQKEYALRILSEFSDSLLQLQSEAFLFGSSEFNIAIEKAFKYVLVFKQEIFSDTFMDGEVAALIELFNGLIPYMESLQEIIKRESPADFIGNYVKKYTKNNAKKENVKLNFKDSHSTQTKSKE